MPLRALNRQDGWRAEAKTYQTANTMDRSSILATYQSGYQSNNAPINQSISQPIDPPISQAICPSINQLTNLCVFYSADLSIYQSANLREYRTNYQTTNQAT